MDIIDVGCGTGNFANYFLNFEPHSLTLIDASENMLSKAKEKLQAPSSSTQLSFKQVVLPDMPYDDNSFDAAMISLVCIPCYKWYHLVSLGPYLNENPNISGFASPRTRP